MAIHIDIPADLNGEDETGLVWTFLEEAADPALIVPGAIVIAGDEGAPPWPRSLTSWRRRPARSCTSGSSLAWSRTTKPSSGAPSLRSPLRARNRPDPVDGQGLSQPLRLSAENLTAVESRLVRVLDRVVCYDGDRAAQPVSAPLRNLAS